METLQESLQIISKMNLTFHHIGVATSNLEASIECYEKLGYQLKDEVIVTDPIQNVRIAFVKRDQHPWIELIAPVDEDSPVNAILKKSGTSPYHTCYEVEDIDQMIVDLKKQRFVVVQKPVPAVAFENRRISFLFHRHTGLIELVEK